MGVLVVRLRGGGRFAIWRDRLSSEIRVDPGDPDPYVWFVKDLDYSDLVGWYPRRLDAIQAAESINEESCHG